MIRWINDYEYTGNIDQRWFDRWSILILNVWFQTWYWQKWSCKGSFWSPILDPHDGTSNSAVPNAQITIHSVVIIRLMEFVNCKLNKILRREYWCQKRLRSEVSRYMAQIHSWIIAQDCEDDKVKVKSYFDGINAIN